MLTSRIACIKPCWRRLPALPDLPTKIGFALDTGTAACLKDGSADFRFELDDGGALMLRADGAEKGRIVTEDAAMEALQELACWFVDTGGGNTGRMARHLSDRRLPSSWMQSIPRSTTTDPLGIGTTHRGCVLGAPFGKINAYDLRALLVDGSTTHVRLLLGRRFLTFGDDAPRTDVFASSQTPLMKTHACPGAPLCPQATVETMSIAKILGPKTEGALHVSGCAKGCAFPKSAPITLVGRDGRFDLVRDGKPWDDPRHRGIDPADLTNFIDRV